MSCSINKKEVYSARYPKGTIIELTEPIDDPYSLKPIGSRFKVESVINCRGTGYHLSQVVLQL